MKTIILANATLIDGTGRDPQPGASVVLRGERIASIHMGAAQPPDDDARVIDVGSRHVLPGLIDAHVHLTIEGGPSGTYEHDETYGILMTLAAAQRTLAAGFTTARDLGGRNLIEFSVRRAIEDGVFAGPRMVLAGRIVSMTSAGAPYWPGMYREADGPDEVRKAVREQLKHGADVVKVMATGSAMTPGEQPVAQYTVDEMRAAVEEAHKAGKPVAAHASGITGIRNALEAGVDHIEHGSCLHEDPAAIAFMAAHGIFLVPTLKAFAVAVARGTDAGIPGWMVEQNRDESENSILSLKRAIAAGVRIALGTDAGGPLNRHGENADELVYMVEAGMSPMQAIVAATRTAAECIGLADRVGTLEPGKLADLLVVSGDPLADIAVLTNPQAIDLVFKGGVVVAGREASQRVSQDILPVTS